MRKAQFITFEGIDGCGKSTQSKRLYDAMQKGGIKAHLTREPGGSKGAEAIRPLIITGDKRRWSAQTEILLFTAARRDHLEKTIAPALARGEHVICDRFADSTRVYQGATRGDMRAMVDTLHDMMIGQEPDITFVIDVDPAQALKRGLARNSGEDRFETFGLEFQIKLRAGFLELAAQNTARIRVIDGNRPADVVFAAIAQQMGLDV